MGLNMTFGVFKNVKYLAGNLLPAFFIESQINLIWSIPLLCFNLALCD